MKERPHFAKLNTNFNLRARYLLDGALYVTEKLDGKFPTTTSELLKIPGKDSVMRGQIISRSWASEA